MNMDDLAQGLESLKPTMDESVGIERFATAWTDYFYESGLSVPPAEPVFGVIGGALEPARAAMVAAMTGATNGAEPAGITAGITAFWGALVSTPAIIWEALPPISAVTPPPNLAGINAAVLAAGQANIASAASKEQAAQVMAAAIHPLNLGGTATDSASAVWGVV